jgi:uncharacterized membrane protein
MRLDLQNVIQAEESTYTVNHFYFINYLLVFLKLKYLVLSVISLLRCRRDYRKRENNVKKILLDLIADLGVFEGGT